MAAEKVTTMVLQVDLQCPCCYKKVKKILCKIPQVRDQVFDEKANKVIIVVVCCSPEKIQKKICSKGGGVIKSVEIVQPKKPVEKPSDPVEKKKEAEKPKEPEKKKEAEKPKEQEKKKEAEKPKEAEKKKEADKPKEAEKPKDAHKPEQQKPPAGPAPAPKIPVPVYATHPVQGYPPVYPIGICYGPYYDVYGAGPGHNVPPQQPNYGYDYGAPQPCYDYGRPPCHCGCGGRRGCDYYSEENASACSVM